MERYLNEEQIGELRNRGLSDREIKKLKETLKWYYKKHNKIKVEINGDNILKLDNLTELMEERAAYGIEGAGVLRKLILKEIDKKNSEYLYKDLFAATIWNSAPNYEEMGGTQYYRVYLKVDTLKLYCLDNFFRLVEIKEYPIEEIKGCWLRDSLSFEKQNLKIYHMLIKVSDDITDGRLFMYSTKKINESKMPELYKLLKEKNVPELQEKKAQIRTTVSIGGWLAIAAIVIIVGSVMINTLGGVK